MKKLIFITLLAFSCENADVGDGTKLIEVKPQDFIGIWKATDKSEEGAKIEISGVGEEFKVIYTYKADRPKTDLIPVTYLTQFESNAGDPFHPRLKTIDKINGQYVTFDYIRMSNSPDKITNLSTPGFFQK